MCSPCAVIVRRVEPAKPDMSTFIFVAQTVSLCNLVGFYQGYLVLGFLSILAEKSRFGDRSYSEGS